RQAGQPADAVLDDQHNTIECVEFRRPADPRVLWIGSSVEGDGVAESISRTNVAGNRLNAACIGSLIHHEQNIHFEACCPPVARRSWPPLSLEDGHQLFEAALIAMVRCQMGARLQHRVPIKLWPLRYVVEPRC